MKKDKNWLKYIFIYIIGFLIFSILSSITQINMLKSLGININFTTIIMHTIKDGIGLYTILYFLILVSNIFYNVILIKKLNEKSQKIRNVSTEKILKERKVITMKKRMLLIILLIIVIMLIIFGIDIFRKVNIIDNYSRKLEEYQNLTNFHTKSIVSNNGKNYYTDETWLKDDVCNRKTTSEDGKIEYLYTNKSEILILTENTDNQKVGTRFKNDGDFPYNGSKIEYANYYIENNLWDEIKAALTAKITTEILDGKECYKFYIDDNFQFFVDKENLLKIKEINGSTRYQLIDYSIGHTTDADVAEPNTEGYTITEGNTIKED